MAIAKRLFLGIINVTWFRLAIVAVLLGISGCAKEAAVLGLRPLDPPVMKSGRRLDSPTVASVQPTLRWTALAVVGGSTQDTITPSFEGIEASKIGDVSYDLRVWRVVEGDPADRVYERFDLKAPFHRLEEPLNPDTQYYWSVRVRFRLDGETRLSEWSMSLDPRKSPNPLTPDLSGQRIARKTGRIPATNYFRFETPK